MDDPKRLAYAQASHSLRRPDDRLICDADPGRVRVDNPLDSEGTEAGREPVLTRLIFKAISK